MLSVILCIASVFLNSDNFIYINLLTLFFRICILYMHILFPPLPHNCFCKPIQQDLLKMNKFKTKDMAVMS